MAGRVPQEVVDRLTRELVDNGRLVEAGWISFKLMVVPTNASQVQLDEMRNSFFAGAQHLFGSITTMLEAGEEATETDLRRMSQINTELDEFLQRLKLRVEQPRGSA